MEQILSYKSIIWDGTHTGKNLLPLREQILSYKSTIPGSGSVFWYALIASSITVLSIQSFRLCHVCLCQYFRAVTVILPFTVTDLLFPYFLSPAAILFASLIFLANYLSSAWCEV